ncbi:MAG: tetratricopeptide repeat protein [Bacteroidota bacterium]
MENEDKDIALAEGYIEGSLTENERSDFEKRLMEEKELQELLNDMKTLTVGIAYAGRESARQKIAELEASFQEENEETKVIPIWQNRKFFAAAAVVAILLVSTFTIFNLNQSPSSEALFQTYYEPYMILSGSGTRNTDSESAANDQDKALIAYEQQKYEEAIAILEPIQQDNEINKFYLSSAYLASGQAEKAIDGFQGVISSGGEYTRQAQWYLALSYVKLGDVEEAKSALSVIIESGSAYSKKAKALFVQLD